jgi:hypothetical protein
VLRAVATLARIELSLRTSDLPSTCRRLQVGLDVTRTPPATGRPLLPDWARRGMRASHLVASYWPAGDTCLRRCLLVGHRLRKLGPVLRIGVKRTRTGEFAAHSWLEIDGRTLDTSAAGFAPLAATGN